MAEGVAARAPADAPSKQTYEGSPISVDATFDALMVPCKLGEDRGWLTTTEDGEIDIMSEFSLASGDENYFPHGEEFFNHTFYHEGFKFFRNDPANNVPGGCVPSMRIEVAALVGTPRAQLAMWNPRDHSEFWYSPGLKALHAGSNVVRLTQPTDGIAETWFTYAIVLGKGDAVSLKSVCVDGGSRLRCDQVLTLSYTGMADGWELI
ncbi:hypothetical protein AB1Y20_000332 [Prymnesium parvum]|uniref:Beta-galactosidase n=1 Tax=Prymnesium parvum TaxID=97485 RepID=A0AB34K540_PRYPA